MGLFSCLNPVQGSRPGIRVRKKDVTVPHCIKLALLDGHVPFISQKDLDQEPIDSVVLERHYLWGNVKRVPVRHGQIRGTMFIPQGTPVVGL